MHELVGERLDLSADLGERLGGVDDDKSIRLIVGNLQVALANPLEEIMALLLEAVRRAAFAGTFHADFHGRVE